MSASRTRILLVEDHQMVREGLRSLLAGEPDFQVVGEAADGADAIRLAGALAPDVVVMDIGLVVVSGIEADVKRVVDEATEKCKAAPMPPMDLLTTDVYADGGWAWRN